MDYLLKNANVFVDNKFRKTDIFVRDGIIVSVDKDFRAHPKALMLHEPPRHLPQG